MPGAAVAQPALSARSTLRERMGLADGEVVILALRPSFWFVAIKRAGWLASLAIIWSVLALIESLGWYDFALYPLALAFVIVAVLVLLWLAIDRASRLYLLTDKRVLRVSGILTRTTVEIPLHQVTSVALHRTFTARLTGVGSLLFTSAAAPSGGGDLVWYIVGNPVSIVRTVRETLATYGDSGGAGRGGS